MNCTNAKMLRNHLHSPLTTDLGKLQLEMHEDGGDQHLRFLSLRVGRVAEHMHCGWVAAGCAAHISLFARDERPHMSAQWQQQCHICKRILFEHKLHLGAPCLLQHASRCIHFVPKNRHVSSACYCSPLLHLSSSIHFGSKTRHKRRSRRLLSKPCRVVP